MKLSCEAALPDKKSKEVIWKQLLGFDTSQKLLETNSTNQTAHAE